jgi:hypothetical protein
MSQDQYTLSDEEISLLRDFFESFQSMVFELIESRRIKAKEDWPDRQNFSSIYEKMDALAQQNFDF